MGVGVSAEDANTVRLSWQPVTVLEWEVSHYTLYHTVRHTRLDKTVQHYTKSLSNTLTSDPLTLIDTDTKYEHIFQLTASIQVEGEEFESEKSIALTFQFGKTIACSIIELHVNNSTCTQMRAPSNYTSHQ